MTRGLDWIRRSQPNWAALTPVALGYKCQGGEVSLLMGFWYFSDELEALIWSLEFFNDQGAWLKQVQLTKLVQKGHKALVMGLLQVSAMDILGFNDVTIIFRLYPNYMNLGYPFGLAGTTVVG